MAKSKWARAHCHHQLGFTFSQSRLVTSITVAIALVCDTRADAFQTEEDRDATDRIPKAVSGNLGKIISFELVDNRLSIELPRKFHPDMRARINAMGGESGGGQISDVNWEVYAVCDSTAIAARFGDVRYPEIPLSLNVQWIQKNEHGRRLRVVAMDTGLIHVLAFKKDTNECFRFDQLPDGTVFAVTTDSSGIHSISRADFRQLLETASELKADFVTSELRQWGLCEVHKASREQVHALMLKRFAAIEPDSQSKFALALNDLSSTEFGRRETASTWIEENSSKLLSLVLTEMSKTSGDAEIRARLTKILENSLDRERFEAFRTIEAEGPFDDISTLISLLDENLDEVTRANLVKYLEEKTSKSLGANAAAWKDWLTTTKGQASSRVSPSISADPPGAIDISVGALDSVAPSMANLVPLIVNNGRLDVDREKWNEQFGGKSVPQMANELRQHAQSLSLPSQWLNYDELQIEGIEYPHLLFQLLQESVDVLPPIEQLKRTELLKRQFARQTVRRNLRFDFPYLSGLLETEEGRGLTRYFEGQAAETKRGAETKSENVFVVTLIDEKQPQNSLVFGRWPNGAVRILLTASLIHIQVFQAADGKCTLDCAVGDIAFHKEYESAQEIVNDSYFNKVVAPCLKRFGLIIASSANGIAQESTRERLRSFDTDTIGKPPTGFSEALTAGGGPVKWHVVDISDAPSGKQVVAQLSADETETRYPLLILDDFSAKDIDVSVRFRAVAGKVDQAAGIIWRCQDKDNYFVARANVLEGNVVAYKTLAGKRSSIGIKGNAESYGVKTEVPLNKWNTLRVRTIGNLAEIYFNDKKMFEVENDALTSAGKIGLWTKADSVTQFDDLKVTSLDTR